jgi:hypothetical protein
LHVAALLLQHSCALAAAHRDAWVGLQARLLTAELHLLRGTPDSVGEAWAAAEEVERWALRQGYRREEALARRLLGQCALAGGSPAAAAVHLRAALEMLDAIGARLEAARTRRALAETLLVAAGARSEEARQLIADAQVQFASSGASLDLAEAEPLIAAWETR